MKWKLPKDGDERVITKFLIFPLTLNDERRWLEKVEINQVYVKAPLYHKWVNIKFSDQDDESVTSTVVS
jgi:hypothetical protein